jgi:hypothetical protein
MVLDYAVDLFGGGVLLPKAELVIRYYTLFLQSWFDPCYEEFLEYF